MNNLDALDAAKGGPFVFRHSGEERTAPHPADLPYQVVLLGLQDEVMPDTPPDLAYWKVQALFEAWQMHYDLPDFNNGRRLAYLADHYIDTLTYDLQFYLGVDLGSLWRARRWNTLLAMIDRLPAWSSYYAAVANDPEHAEMAATAMEEGENREDPETSGPALTSWTPEVEVLTRVVDAVKALHYLIPAAAGSKSVKPPPPEPRPVTLLDSARRRAAYKVKKTRHEALAARMLPHKYPPSDEPPR
jgi:hypothetical protein